MNQCPPSRDTVADLTLPPSGRDIRNRVHPNLGRKTRPHLRLIRSTGRSLAVGNRNEGRHFAFDFQCTVQVPCLRHPYFRRTFTSRRLEHIIIWSMSQDAEYRRGRHVISAMHVHLVFVTRCRGNVFDDAMLRRCEDVMIEVCDGFEAELREFDGGHEHVRLLVHYPPKVAISRLVNSLKGVSSHYLRKEFTGRGDPAVIRGPFWSPSYLAASCGGAPLSIIDEYIEQQRRPA
jgi:putative transposase